MTKDYVRTTLRPPQLTRGQTEKLEGLIYKSIVRALETGYFSGRGEVSWFSKNLINALAEEGFLRPDFDTLNEGI